MYFNTKLIKEKGYIINDAVVLQLIHQNKSNDESKSIVENITDRQLELFYEKELVEEIKGTKKQNQFQKMRLTSKGKKLLKLFTEEIEGADENDEILLNWLIKYYRKSGKEVGNTKRTKKYLINFRKETGIERNHLAFLFKEFLSSEEFIEKSNVLEYALFYPKKFTTDGGKTIAYEAKWDIEDSWLYRFYRKKKDWFDKEFKKIPN